jgi:glutathionylspermidine synthase
MNLDSPWRAVHPLPPGCRRELRRRAIFECCKWDPQVEDVDTLAPLAIVLKHSAWREMAALSEALYAETLRLEEALVLRPDLHRRLALPRKIRVALAAEAGSLQARKPAGENPPHLRVMRFDFHPTPAGWRVSEVNSDVPGGYNEASGWSSLVAEHIPQGILAGDPSRSLVNGIRDRVPAGGTVALVHATAYTDDRQVMSYLSHRILQTGLRAVLVGPDHIRWQQGRAFIETDWFSGPADFVFRFFPAEWLPNLGRLADWPKFFAGAATPLCNPATALLTQSKRWPLVLQDLGLSLPTWRRLLPDTRDPREVDWTHDSNWVVKPALGRVGELVGIADVTSARDWKLIRRSVRWGARHWVAQQRFIPTPIHVDGEHWHGCFGVYVIDGHAAGIYGRVAGQPLINHTARDAAILVEPAATASESSIPSHAYESIGTF